MDDILRTDIVALQDLPPSLPIGPMSDAWVGSNVVSSDLKTQWIQNGFSVLRGAYSAEEVLKYNEIVSEFRRDFPTGEDEYGFGDRVGQLHQRHPELLELASRPEVMDFR